MLRKKYVSKRLSPYLVLQYYLLPSAVMEVIRYQIGYRIPWFPIQLYPEKLQFEITEKALCHTLMH